MSEIKLRIDPEIKEKLKLEAKEQKRSLNNLIEVVLGEFLNEVNQRKMECEE